MSIRGKTAGLMLEFPVCSPWHIYCDFLNWRALHSVTNSKLGFCIERFSSAKELDEEYFRRYRSDILRQPHLRYGK